MSHEWPRASWHLVLLAWHYVTSRETLTEVLAMLVLGGLGKESGT